MLSITHALETQELGKGVQQKSSFLSRVTKHALVQCCYENWNIGKELTPPGGGPQKRLKRALNGKQDPSHVHYLAGASAKLKQAVSLVDSHLVGTFQGRTAMRVQVVTEGRLSSTHSSSTGWRQMNIHE